MINYLYFLIDKRKVVYIGRTKNIGTRIDKHRLNKKFNHVRFIECDICLLSHYENRWITKFNPIYNINGKRSKGTKEEIENTKGWKTVSEYAYENKLTVNQVHSRLT